MAKHVLLRIRRLLDELIDHSHQLVPLDPLLSPFAPAARAASFHRSRRCLDRLHRPRHQLFQGRRRRIVRQVFPQLLPEASLARESRPCSSASFSNSSGESSPFSWEGAGELRLVLEVSFCCSRTGPQSPPRTAAAPRRPGSGSGIQRATPPPPPPCARHPAGVSFVFWKMTSRYSSARASNSSWRCFRSSASSSLRWEASCSASASSFLGLPVSGAR